MLKKNTKTNKIFKLFQKISNHYLFSSPYDKVIAILKSIKDFLSSFNNNKAIEELNWAINIISNNLLYSFKSSSYYNKNISILEGNHKIKDFGHEVEQYNKEYENLYNKYLHILTKNEEMTKYISDTEKNISIIKSRNQNNFFNKVNSNKEINSIKMLKNLKKSKKFFSQISVQLLKDYNQVVLGNKSISDIYYTESSGFSSKKEEKNKINSNENKIKKELSYVSPVTIRNNINKKTKYSLYNKYQIYSVPSKNRINSNRNLSCLLCYDNIDYNSGENNNVSNITNNNPKNKKMEKIISLPLIKFNQLNNRSIIENNKNNNTSIKGNNNNKNNLYFNHQNNYIKQTNNNIIIALGQQNIPLSINNEIDINKMFDYNKFNIFDLKDKIGLDNIMPFLGKEIIKKLNIYNLFDTSKIDKFLMTISKNYLNTREVLYHTSLHGVDACYSTYLLITLFKNEDKIINISQFDIGSLIIAALCHDIGHPGVSNKFLINSKNELSIFYNDISVLENFQKEKTFQLLENDDINIFSNFSNEKYLLMRKKIITEILATDMTYHFKVIEEFKEYKKNKDKKLEQNQLNFILHTADLAHNFKQFEISIKWIELLTNEFWIQGDKEKELGLPVSYLCDRNDINVPKSQIGFITNFIFPIIKELVDSNQKCLFFEKNANNNLNNWKNLEKEKRKRGWTPDKK